MRVQSPEYCGSNARQSTMGIVRAAVALTAIVLVGGAGIPRSAAQEAATDVAYVEAMSGRVIALSRGTPVLLDTLDIISDRTRLDLQANSDLSICHYRTKRLLALKGPTRAMISADGATAETGKAIAASAGTCVAPVISSFQGGMVARGAAFKPTIVALQPSIKVINRGTVPINTIALWDHDQQTLLATFGRREAHPTFEDGQSYFLVVERSDGSELKMLLKGSATTQTGPLILIVP
jgi:hypothetical protein